MRVRPLIWFLGLVGTLAALSIAVGSGRIIHAQVYGSSPLPPNSTVTVPPIQVNAVNPPPPPGPPAPPSTPPQTTTTTEPSAPPISVSAVNPQPAASSGSNAAPPARATVAASGLPSLGVMSKMTDLIEQPLFELLVGVGILSALGIFFAWNAHTSRTLRTLPAAPVAGAASAAGGFAPRVRTAPRAADPSLTPLTARFRPLGALRERDRS